MFLTWFPFLIGQSEIRPIWNKYYAECHAVCFVIDSTDEDRLEECWKVFGEFQTLALGIHF